jgi:hypothetical protein
MKFYNFYGQLGARLDADQPVYAKDGNDSEGNSFLFAFLDFLLFRAPSARIEDLQIIWVDNTINYIRWKSFASSLNTEWSGFTIYVGDWFVATDRYMTIL